jgi:coenzyme F420-reducing hydrogenase gamma subunit
MSWRMWRQRRRRNEQYAALIKEGDALMTKKEYENSKSKFVAALEIKENEAYPKQKIKELDVLIADAAKRAEEERKAKELEEKYKTAIATRRCGLQGGEVR